MRERAPKLSLDTAARIAYEQGLLSKDYYSFNRDEQEILRSLLKETQYRQPAGGRARGHAPQYDLWLALGRSAERQFRAQRRRWERADSKRRSS